MTVGKMAIKLMDAKNVAPPMNPSVNEYWYILGSSECGPVQETLWRSGSVQLATPSVIVLFIFEIFSSSSKIQIGNDITSGLS